MNTIEKELDSLDSKNPMEQYNIVLELVDIEYLGNGSWSNSLIVQDINGIPLK